MMDRKGFTEQIMTMFIIGGVLVALFFIFFMWSVVGPILLKTSGDLTSTVSEAVSFDSTISNVTNSTVVKVNQGVQNLQWISYVVYIVLLIGFIMICATIRQYPFLIIIWIAIIAIATIFSIYITSTYEGIASGDPVYTSSGWGFNNYLMLYSPFILPIVGFIGGGFMLYLIRKDDQLNAQYNQYGY